ncbi:unnamed protein product [Bursaphelenchus okinawaensis]|uniref:G-protein coupled receptors family 1 profile domain-containing protein n=1 Tax=Bursaphelenchus okinawaensis TaxID=465554 RepID=A0A811LMJ2_9BILA|nr:unnamed protein product [Bursaphelenchus okinawaensis]CAG9124167.1 unnamed protein product [Bursaphelenchus okinawaensis]
MSNTTIDYPYTGNFSTVENEYLYKTYYGKGVQFELLFTPIIYFTCMLVSYGGNAVVIIATISNKNLHGSYNFLLCMVCLGDMMHLSTHWLYLGNMATGNNFIPYKYCFYADCFFQVGATLSITMTFFVGIDRLIGVSMPTTYRGLNVYMYDGFFLFIALAFSALVFVLGLQHSWGPFGEEPIQCRIIDSFGGAAGAVWFRMCVILNLLDIFVYTAVWILIKKKAGTSDAMRKVFKSLVVIMITVVVGWMLDAFVEAILLPYGNIPISHWYYYESVFGIFINLASASNVFVMYFFSAEYQLTIQRLFKMKGSVSGKAGMVTSSNIQI